MSAVRVVRLSTRTRVRDDGRLLVGGSAGSVVRLRPGAAVRTGPDGTLLAGDALARRLVAELVERGFADPLPGGRRSGAATVDVVTVVVPVRDDAAGVARLLAALPAGLAVVVVDDGSADALALRRAACARPGVRVLRHERNQGPAGARNTGLRAVATPFVCFCDADVVPEGDWLEVLLGHLDDPAVAAVAPRVLGEREGRAALAGYERVRSSLDLGPHPAPVRAGTAVSYVPSACLLARVDALGDGFCEAMRVAEDVDLVWRLDAGGARVRYEPAAVVRHEHRTRPGAWLRRKAYYGSGAASLAARHGDVVAPVVLAPWNVALAAAVLAQRRWSAPVAVATVVVTVVATRRRLGPGVGSVRTAGEIVASGVTATAQQTAGSLLRHHWPLAAAGCLVSQRARRAVAVAAVAEAVVDRARHPATVATGAGPGPLAYLLAHRADDLAYGAGLWWGCLRARSPRALLPRWVGPRRPRPRPCL